RQSGEQCAGARPSQALEHVDQLGAHFLGRAAERRLDARARAEHVDGHRVARALHALEEEGRFLLADRPLRDLGDLVLGIDLGGHAMEIAARFEVSEKGAEVRERQSAYSRSSERQPPGTSTPSRRRSFPVVARTSSSTVSGLPYHGGESGKTMAPSRE